MPDDSHRDLKIQALLALANDMRRQANAGIKSDMNTVLADHLMQRIARIEAGENDFSAVALDDDASRPQEE